MRRKFRYLAATLFFLLLAVWVSKEGSTRVESGEEKAQEAGSDGEKEQEAEGGREKKASWSREAELERYARGLPVVRITMKDGKQPMLRTPLWAELDLYEDSTDLFAQKMDVQLWIRGQSSATYPKKQYGIDVYDAVQSDRAKDVAILGMPAESDWILNGPYQDRSLIRNVLMYGVSRELMDWAPDTRFCEVWLNGSFEGLYVMTENVKVSKNRLDLYDYGFSSGETAYLLLRDRAGKDMPYLDPFGSQSGKATGTVYVKFPKEGKLSDRQADWIEDDVSEIERLFYMDGIDDSYLDRIDLDSFVDYYILNEFSMNRDAGSYSTYCYRDMKGKLCMGPVWDFNNSFNNYVEPLYTDSFIVSSNNWFARLMESREFVDAVVKRYQELRRGILSEQALYERIDTYVQVLADAHRRDWERWPQVITEESRHSASFEEALEHLKTCIHDRGIWMDENIEKLYSYNR